MDEEWKKAARKSVKSRELLISVSDNNYEEIIRLINEGVDINFKDEDGYTALSLAVEYADVKVVQLLINEGADTTIKNVKGETPLDIGKRMERSEIIKVLEEISSENLQSAGTSEISVSQQDEVSKETEEHVSWINPVHGYIFQLKVLMLFLHRGVACKYSFRLGTEIRKAQKFDDLLFEYTQDDTKIYRLLQAKHKINEKKKITVDKLLSETKGDFSLVKYFRSYYNCKRDEYFKDGVIKDVTICTNINFDFDDLKKCTIQVEKIKEKDDILDVESETKQPIRYKFNNESILPVLKKKLKSTKFSSVREVQDDEIEDFLNHLVFAVDQPNEQELGSIVKKEIGKELDSITTENAYNKFFVKILEWMKHKNRFITYQEGKDFFDEIKKDSFLWHNVQDPVQSFTGRKEQLENMHKLLQASSNSMICICGLGGVGKSELVKRYIALYSQHYDNKIIWLNAESYECLVDSFYTLACDKLDISTTNANGKEKNIYSLVTEVYQYFSKSKSLFIFDNLEMYHSDTYFYSGIDKFLPSLPNHCNKPNIIVTSRNHKWPEIMKILVLDGFTENEAKTFVKNYLHLNSNEQEKDVYQLGKILQFLPLALSQAVAYIKAQNTKFCNPEKNYQISDYINNFSKKCREFLSFELPNDCNHKYSKTVLSSWDITFDVLNRQEKGYYALKLLYIIAYLLPENISVKLLCSLFQNDEKMIQAINLLDQYSLIDVHHKVLSVHRLVQQITRIKLVERNKEVHVLANIMETIERSRKPIVTSKNVDHFLPVLTHVKKYVFLLKEFINAFYQISQVLISSGRNKAVYHLCSEYTNVLNQSTLNNRDFEYLLSIVKLCNADAFLSDGKLEEALQEYYQVHDSFQAMGWTEKIFELKVAIANALRQLGQDSKALQWEKPLNDIWGSLEDNNFFSVKVTDAIGNSYLEEGEFKKAFKVKELTYIALSMHLGEDHERTIIAKINMVELLEYVNIYGTDMYDKTYDQVRTLDNNQGNLLNVKIRLAGSLYKFGKIEEAKKLYDEIYNYQTSTLIENHPDILSTKTAMADILVKQGNLNDALEIYREVYRITSERFDDNHPQIIPLLASTAKVLHLQDKPEEALEISKDVLKRKRNLYGFNHPRVAETLGFIGDIFKKRGDNVKALESYEEVLQCEISLYGDDSTKTLKTRANIKFILINLNRFDMILEQNLKIYEINKKSYGPNDSRTLGSRQSLGILYAYCKKDYDGALNILTEVLEIQESTWGKDDPVCAGTRHDISFVIKMKS